MVTAWSEPSAGVTDVTRPKRSYSNSVFLMALPEVPFGCHSETDAFHPIGVYVVRRWFHCQHGGFAQPLGRRVFSMAGRPWPSKRTELRATARVLVQVEGQWLRAGLFEGRAFTEAVPFKARFTFARNPNLGANARFPLAVWTYDVSR